MMKWRKGDAANNLGVDMSVIQAVFTAITITAGFTVGITDPETREIRNTQVIVAVPGASSYTWAEATWSQLLEDWMMSHVRRTELQA